MANILQAALLTDFLYPFLVMFFLTFAILEKSKLLGEGQKQLNAMVGLVVGLIFVSAASYVNMATDLVLFMTIGIIIIFVGFILWGFMGGPTTISGKWAKFFGVIIFISVIVAVFVVTGYGESFWDGVQTFFDWVFHSSWSGGFWTNAIVVLLVIGAIVGVLKGGSAAGSGSSK